MQKSTATITWITHRNFGTVLQAYALQRVLTSLGYENRVIDDRKVLDKVPKKKFSPLRLLRRIDWLFPKSASFRRADKEVLREYDDFKNRFIRIDDDWTDREDLADKYDAFIAGSDQIWSPNVPFDDFYYLAFTDRTKISYAPSMGVSEYPEDKVTVIKPLIEKFSTLSVREPHGAKILHDQFGMNAEVVADPTMLLTRNEWEELIPESSHEEHPYALCYFLTYNRKYIDQVKEYCHRHSMKMKMFVVSPELVDIADEDIYTGPIGFLKSIRGADIIFTDSFHGTIFSLIFEKNFHTFKRFSDDSPINQNSRVEHLMDSVGLGDRMIDTHATDIEAAKTDYVKVREVLQSKRETSIRFLKDSLAEV